MAKRQWILNAVSSWAAIGARTVLAIVLVPFLIRHLGRDGYGVIGLLLVLAGLSDVVDLGLRQALSREMSEQAAKKDARAFNELASTGLATYLVIGSILACLMMAAAGPFASVFNVPVSIRDDAIWAVRVFGSSSILLTFVQPVFSSALASMHRYDVTHSINTATAIVSGVALIVVLGIFGGGLSSWVFAMLSAHVVSTLLIAVAAYRVCPWLWIRAGSVKFSRLWDMVTLGGAVYVHQLSQMLSDRSHPLVISYFLGTASVALYTIGSKLSHLMRPLMLVISDQAQPKSTRYHVGARMDMQHRLLIEGTRYTVALAGLAFAGIMVFADGFARLWLERALGRDYLAAADLMRLWAVADMIFALAVMQYPIFVAMRRLRMSGLIHGLSALLTLSMSIWLVGYAGMGPRGALIATIAANAALRLVLIWYGCRVCSLSLVRFIREAMLAPAASTSLVVAVALAARWGIGVHSWIRLALSAAVTAGAWGLSTVVIVMSREERSGILRSVKNKARQLRD